MDMSFGWRDRPAARKKPIANSEWFKEWAKEYNEVRLKLLKSGYPLNRIEIVESK